MSRSTHAFALMIFFLGLTATQTRAGLVLTLGDVNLAPDGTGTMDLSITSNNHDTLSSFDLELLITPSPGATSFLQFTSTQPDPYGNPNYVFSGESFNSDNTLPFWGVPGVTNYPSDTITGGDSDDSSSGHVSIAATLGAPNSYLASVQFQAAPGATLGDQFQVSLINDPNFTYFDDPSGNPLSIDSITGGVVTISPPSVVPEPSSLMMTAISSLTGLLWYFRTLGSRRTRRWSDTLIQIL